jgi:hypothetical protein
VCSFHIIYELSVNWVILQVGTKRSDEPFVLSL